MPLLGRTTPLNVRPEEILDFPTDGFLMGAVVRFVFPVLTPPPLRLTVRELRHLIRESCSI